MNRKNSRYYNLCYLSSILSATIASVPLKQQNLIFWHQVSNLLEKMLTDPTYEPTAEEYSHLNKTKSGLITLQEMMIRRSSSLPDSTRALVNNERMKIRQELEAIPDFKPIKMYCIGKIIRDSRTGRSKIVPLNETTTREHERERNHYHGRGR